MLRRKAGVPTADFARCIVNRDNAFLQLVPSRVAYCHGADATYPTGSSVVGIALRRVAGLDHYLARSRRADEQTRL